MSSARATNHRRRSQSATSSPSYRRSPDSPLRGATKRSYPHQPFLDDTPHKWDVDAWRCKKRRRNLSTEPTSDDLFSLSSERSEPLSEPVVPTPAFAATPAAFHLFPERNARSHRPDALPPSEPSNSTDLQRLRSDAFWALHQSVVESGEGLVRRMRDYELSRSRAEAYSKAKEAHRRGRKHSSLIISSCKASEATTRLHANEDEDDEDVQIFAGEACEVFTESLRQKKRAMSLELMDVDSPKTPSRSKIRGSRSSSPGASSSSVCPSDDEHSSRAVHAPSLSPSSSHSKGSFYAPALSHTTSHSSNSSLSSLPLSSSISSLSHHLQPTLPSTSTASRSEKALAVLSLAMANGAGSIDDYQALRTLHPHSSFDDCHVGEMWH